MANIRLPIRLDPQQKRFMSCPAQEILCSGNKGGGKSIALLIKNYELSLSRPHMHIGLFRRSLPEIKGHLLPKIYELYPQQVYKHKVADNKLKWINGSTTSLCFIESDRDISRYHGWEFDAILIDEATNFTQYQISCIKAMLRSAKENYNVRIYYFTNPGGVSHMYFKKRYVDGKKPFKLYPTPETKDSKIKVYQSFIPLRLELNEHLMKNDPTYIDRLKELPDREQQALLHGSWDITAGQFFYMWSEKVHIIDSYVPQTYDQLFIAFDFGVTKPFSVGWYALTSDERMIRYREWYGIKRDRADVGLELTAEEIALGILERTPETEDVKYMVSDYSISSKDGHEMSILEIMSDKLSPRGISMIKSKKNRKHGLELIKKWLTKDKQGIPSFMVTKDCKHFIRTLPEMMSDPQNDGDLLKAQEDHCVDECQYMFMSRPMPKRVREANNVPLNSIAGLKKNKLLTRI